MRGDFILHKYAEKLLKFIENEDKIQVCTIATNCIVIPNDKILNILKNNRFVVRISNYGTANEKNENILIQKCQQYGIKYSFHKYANGNGYWSNCGSIHMEKHSKDETVKNYLSCIFKMCTTLENGLISRCSRSTVAHKLQKFNPAKNDFINVRSPFFSISKLKNFIKIKDLPKGIVKACYFCNGTSGEKIPAGEQLSLEEYKKYKAENHFRISKPPRH